MTKLVLSLFKIVSLAFCGNCPCPMLPLNDNKNKIEPGAQALWLLTVASSHPSVVFTAFSALTSCMLSPSRLWLLQLPTERQCPRVMNSKLCPLRSWRSSEAQSFIYILDHEQEGFGIGSSSFLPMCSRSPQPLVLPPAHHLSTAWEIRERGKETGKREGREEMEDFLRSSNMVETQERLVLPSWLNLKAEWKLSQNSFFPGALSLFSEGLQLPRWSPNSRGSSILL